MRNGVQHFPESTLIEWTNGTDDAVTAPGLKAAAGNIVNFGGRVALPQIDIAVGARGVVHTHGRFRMNKGTGYALAVGQRGAWDGTKVVAYSPAVIAAGGLDAGIVARAAVTGDTEVEMNIEPVPLRVFQIAHVATSDENTANVAVIDTGFGAAPTGAVIVQIKNTSNVVRVPQGAVTFPGGADLGKISIADSGLAAGEIINVIAYE